MPLSGGIMQYQFSEDFIGEIVDLAKEITRTPRVVNNPEAQECTHQDIYDAAQAEIAEHSAVSHEAFTQMYDNQQKEYSSAREELEERYWSDRFEAERIQAEKVQADWQTFRERSKR
jgi:hypothetical protein